MKTIAFYSYKGGVGRSLLVANAARFLGMLGKRVVALDLDIEAPGLHYKLGQGLDSEFPFTGGAVPYLVATAKGAKNPPPLNNHLIELAMPKGTRGWLRLMPAGPAPNREYWIALKQLREQLRFDNPSGKGLAALFDLHARIQEELEPDYLLIDSRTGVTELGGLATTTLADCVVCLFVANQESIDGTLAIIEALKTSTQQSKRDPIRVIPVVARVTDNISDEGQTAEGIKRLVKISEGRGTDNKKDLKPFVLPHDSLLGTTDKVVGGEKKASAFSPLHKAYLELFQNLFPQARQEAEQVLFRLEAVAKLKRELTDQRQRRFRSTERGIFAPWEDTAIEEGVVIRSKQDTKTSRYADLVCRGPNDETLMIVEYIPGSEESEVMQFWSKHSQARCVILLCQQEKNNWDTRKIYCRAKGWGEELQPTERYTPPAPIEFEIYENPGDRSVTQVLEALHRGNEDMVPELIAHWKECMGLHDDKMHMKGFGRWRPVEARSILDGLAATEKTEVAVRILRNAAHFSFQSWGDEDFEMRHGFHNASMSATLIGMELFAPLLWRLPVEATCAYWGEPPHPGWTPCLTGHRLLAEDLMGLRYDPVRDALKESNFLAAQAPDGKFEEGDRDDRTSHLIYRKLRQSRPRLSKDAPPILLWDQKLREDHYWAGELDGLDKKTLDKAKNLMSEPFQLQTWLRGRISRGVLTTCSLFGRYDPSFARIELYTTILDALAPLLGLQPRYLKNIVFIQLSVLAIAHQARDCDGQMGFGFATALPTNPFQKESPAHITISQYFAFRLIERLGDMNLMGAFEKLSDHQPEQYRSWRRMRHIPVEQMRTVLLRARLGEAALGLPPAIQE